MKKALGLISLLVFVFSCKTESEKIDRFKENGVEVIANRIEPYKKIKAGAENLVFREEFNIDTRNPELAAKGLTDIFQFDVDSLGDIYFLVPLRGEGDFVHKYHGEKFVMSFGKRGQGPGELQYPYPLRINSQDEIMVGDSPNKLLFYDKDGKFLRQQTTSDLEGPQPLKNGTYLAYSTKSVDSSQTFNPLVLALFSSDFKEIKELDRFTKWPNQMVAESISEKYISGIEFVLVGRASGEHFYTGNSERGYEILVFDLEGRILRKIRKDYRPVEVSEDYRENFLRPFEGIEDPFTRAYIERVYFPKEWHPFHSFFPDEEGRLYVMTYEKGLSDSERMFDIFSADGLFIARKSLNVSHNDGSMTREVHAKCQN
jgi:hypothetical protein